MTGVAGRGWNRDRDANGPAQVRLDIVVNRARVVGGKGSTITGNTVTITFRGGV